MFGTPVVLNVYLLIPFIFVPVINAIIAYVTMATGIVHATVGVVIPWMMQQIISGFLATGSHVSGAVLQIVCSYLIRCYTSHSSSWLTVNVKCLKGNKLQTKRQKKWRFKRR